MWFAPGASLCVCLSLLGFAGWHRLLACGRFPVCPCNTLTSEMPGYGCWVNYLITIILLIVKIEHP